MAPRAGFYRRFIVKSPQHKVIIKMRPVPSGFGIPSGRLRLTGWIKINGKRHGTGPCLILTTNLKAGNGERFFVEQLTDARS
jgi:hypothetical protein